MVSRCADDARDKTGTASNTAQLCGEVHNDAQELHHTSHSSTHTSSSAKDAVTDVRLQPGVKQIVQIRRRGESTRKLNLTENGGKAQGVVRTTSGHSVSNQHQDTKPIANPRPDKLESYRQQSVTRISKPTSTSSRVGTEITRSSTVCNSSCTGGGDHIPHHKAERRISWTTNEPIKAPPVFKVPILVPKSRTTRSGGDAKSQSNTSDIYNLAKSSTDSVNASAVVTAHAGDESNALVVSSECIPSDKLDCNVASDKDCTGATGGGEVVDSKSFKVRRTLDSTRYASSLKVQFEKPTCRLSDAPSGSIDNADQMPSDTLGSVVNSMKITKNTTKVDATAGTSTDTPAQAMTIQNKTDAKRERKSKLGAILRNVASAPQRATPPMSGTESGDGRNEAHNQYGESADKQSVRPHSALVTVSNHGELSVDSQDPNTHSGQLSKKSSSSSRRSVSPRNLTAMASARVLTRVATSITAKHKKIETNIKLESKRERDRKVGEKSKCQLEDSLVEEYRRRKLAGTAMSYTQAPAVDTPTPLTTTREKGLSDSKAGPAVTDNAGVFTTPDNRNKPMEKRSESCVPVFVGRGAPPSRPQSMYEIDGSVGYAEHTLSNRQPRSAVQRTDNGTVDNVPSVLPAQPRGSSYQQRATYGYSYSTPSRGTNLANSTRRLSPSHRYSSQPNLSQTKGRPMPHRCPNVGQTGRSQSVLGDRSQGLARSSVQRGIRRRPHSMSDYGSAGNLSSINRLGGSRDRPRRVYPNSATNRSISMPTQQHQFSQSKERRGHNSPQIRNPTAQTYFQHTRSRTPTEHYKSPNTYTPQRSTSSSHSGMGSIDSSSLDDQGFKSASPSQNYYAHDVQSRRQSGQTTNGLASRSGGGGSRVVGSGGQYYYRAVSGRTPAATGSMYGARPRSYHRSNSYTPTHTTTATNQLATRHSDSLVHTKRFGGTLIRTDSNTSSQSNPRVESVRDEYQAHTKEEKQPHRTSTRVDEVGPGGGGYSSDTPHSSSSRSMYYRQSSWDERPSEYALSRVTEENHVDSYDTSAGGSVGQYMGDSEGCVGYDFCSASGLSDCDSDDMSGRGSVLYSDGDTRRSRAPLVKAMRGLTVHDPSDRSYNENNLPHQDVNYNDFNLLQHSSSYSDGIQSKPSHKPSIERISESVSKRSMRPSKSLVAQARKLLIPKQRPSKSELIEDIEVKDDLTHNHRHSTEAVSNQDVDKARIVKDGGKKQRHSTTLTNDLTHSGEFMQYLSDVERAGECTKNTQTGDYTTGHIDTVQLKPGQAKRVTFNDTPTAFLVASSRTYDRGAAKYLDLNHYTEYETDGVYIELMRYKLLEMQVHEKSYVNTDLHLAWADKAQTRERQLILRCILDELKGAKATESSGECAA